MAERKSGQERAHIALLDVKDPDILAAVEHIANGSTPTYLDQERVFGIPNGILSGRSCEEITEKRREQGIIPALSISEELFGPVTALKKTILLRLSDIDPVTNAVEIPELYGVFIKDDPESSFGKLITDMERLRQMGIKAEDVRSCLIGKLARWRSEYSRQEAV